MTTSINTWRQNRFSWTPTCECYHICCGVIPLVAVAYKITELQVYVFTVYGNVGKLVTRTLLSLLQVIRLRLPVIMTYPTVLVGFVHSRRVCSFPSANRADQLPLISVNIIIQTCSVSFGHRAENGKSGSSRLLT